MRGLWPLLKGSGLSQGSVSAMGKVLGWLYLPLVPPFHPSPILGVPRATQPQAGASAASVLASIAVLLKNRHFWQEKKDTKTERKTTTITSLSVGKQTALDSQIALKAGWCNLLRLLSLFHSIPGCQELSLLWFRVFLWKEQVKRKYSLFFKLTAFLEKKKEELLWMSELV